MIEIVKAEIVKAIRKADRDTINQGYEHDFKISKRSLEKVYVQVMKRTLDDKGMPGALNEQTLNRLATETVNENFNETRHNDEYKTIAGSTEANTLTYHQGGDTLTINFPMKGYGIKPPTNKGNTSPFTANQRTMAILDSMALSTLRDSMNKELSSGSVSKNDLKRGQRGREGDEGFLGLQGQHGSFANPSTVAAFGGAEKLKEMDMSGGFNEMADKAELQAARDRGAPINDMYTKIYKIYEKAFYADVKLEHLQDLTIEEMRKELKVEINYEPANKNATMKDFDSRQLQKFILEHTAEINDELAKQFSKEELETSRSAKDHLIGASIKSSIQKMFPHKSSPDMRLKVNKALLAFSDQKKNEKAKIKVKRKKPRVKTTKAKSVKKARASGNVLRTAALQQQNPLALRNLLNELLPPAVAQKMVSPRLRYRTGRFANSVRVDNILQGPRGGNTMIEATYRKDPYETFAPGGKKYTFQRDPERLIKQSIRQVASGLLGTRFGVAIK